MGRVQFHHDHGNQAAGALHQARIPADGVAAVASHDRHVGVDQDRRVETELRDARRDLIDLPGAVLAAVAIVGLDRGQRHDRKVFGEYLHGAGDSTLRARVANLGKIFPSLQTRCCWPEANPFWTD